MEDRRILLFVDNHGAQDCIVKGSASFDIWRRPLLRTKDLDDHLFFNMRNFTVPPASNPAVHPSKGSLSELSFLNCFADAT